jgi:predicted DNA-binding protein (UPF0251 family)
VKPKATRRKDRAAGEDISSPASISAGQAEVLIKANLLNIARKAQSGKTLTQAEIQILEEARGNEFEKVRTKSSQGLSIAEIAAELGVARGTVQARLKAAGIDATGGTLRWKDVVAACSGGDWRSERTRLLRAQAAKSEHDLVTGGTGAEFNQKGQAFDPDRPCPTVLGTKPNQFAVEGLDMSRSAIGKGWDRLRTRS